VPTPLLTTDLEAIKIYSKHSDQLKLNGQPYRFAKSDTVEKNDTFIILIMMFRIGQVGGVLNA
jgi:hypothetical protein